MSPEHSNPTTSLSPTAILEAATIRVHYWATTTPTAFMNTSSTEDSPTEHDRQSVSNLVDFTTIDTDFLAAADKAHLAARCVVLIGKLLGGVVAITIDVRRGDLRRSTHWYSEIHREENHKEISRNDSVHFVREANSSKLIWGGGEYPKTPHISSDAPMDSFLKPKILTLVLHHGEQATTSSSVILIFNFYFKVTNHQSYLS